VTERSPYLLETSVVIDISKNIEPATSLVDGWLAGSNEVGVCQVVVAEFFTGVPATQRRKWTEFIARWSASPEVAMQAGILRHDYARLSR
jgi:predicted nucleic acid-binding protein